MFVSYAQGRGLTTIWGGGTSSEFFLLFYSMNFYLKRHCLWCTSYRHIVGLYYGVISTKFEFYFELNFILNFYLNFILNFERYTVCLLYKHILNNWCRRCEPSRVSESSGVSTMHQLVQWGLGKNKTLSILENSQ